LDTIEIKAQGFREGTDEHGFPKSRNSLEQAVSTDEHRRKHTLDDLIVPDDNASDLFADGSETLAKSFGLFLHRFSGCGHGLR
jgi:hypothetical protein